jgi:hypothetical protein
MRTALEYGLAVGVVALIIGSFEVAVAALGRGIMWITGTRTLPPIRDFFRVSINDPFGAMYLLSSYLLRPALWLVIFGALLTGVFALLLALV